MTTEREYREWFKKRNKKNNNPKSLNIGLVIIVLAVIVSFGVYSKRNQLPVGNEQVQSSPPQQDAVNTPKQSAENQKEPVDSPTAQNSFFIDSFLVRIIESYEVGGFDLGYQKKMAQGKFLILKTQVTNTNNVASNFNYSKIQLKDSKERVYPVDLSSSISYQAAYPDLADSLAIAVLPGMTRTFMIIFDVNPDSENFSILPLQP